MKLSRTCLSDALGLHAQHQGFHCTLLGSLKSQESATNHTRAHAGYDGINTGYNDAAVFQQVQPEYLRKPERVCPYMNPMPRMLKSQALKSYSYPATRTRSSGTEIL
ncbi:hypothetical protein [Desulfocurvibacter africanus]|uniref:hypothetical protein n=1 Tax=Desulfocurvibacter africanus TaxID=873 RepID=UPI0011824EE6|nr:hypothetical protein [Desulfocurvibacter africanus]